MESRKAENISFTVKEAVDILLKAARDSGVNMPVMYEKASINVDGTQGQVHVLVVFPLGWKGTMDA